MFTNISKKYFNIKEYMYQVLTLQLLYFSPKKCLKKDIKLVLKAREYPLNCVDKII